jgi:hypothetical protein
VDVSWRDGVLTRAAVRSKLGNPCRFRCGEHVADLATRAGGEYVFDGMLRRVDAAADTVRSNSR